MDSIKKMHSNISGQRRRKMFLVQKHKNIQHWTPEEDRLLLKFAEVNDYKNWNQIAKMVKNRSAVQCTARYKRIRPGIKKGRWKPEEDETLLKYLEKYGKNWS